MEHVIDFVNRYPYQPTSLHFLHHSRGVLASLCQQFNLYQKIPLKDLTAEELRTGAYGDFSCESRENLRRVQSFQHKCFGKKSHHHTPAGEFVACGGFLIQ